MNQWILVILVIMPFTMASIHPVNHDLVQNIKESTQQWIPMEPEDNPFYFVPIEQIKAMMGTKLRVMDIPDEDPTADIPTNFDARDQWSSKIHTIRNQGQCGSCWAFGATEALSDRYAIAGEDVILSPQHLVSCDYGNLGCNGGWLDSAWEFMQVTGVVTDACFPYTSGSTGQDGQCFTSCQDGSTWTTYHSGSYTFGASVTDTQTAIMTNGPVEAAFTVYEDFMNYKSGVYHHTSGSVLGGHAIKAIGWGTTDEGVDYWIMANSWGTTWGDNGFFKIERGDCGIDGQMTFGSAADAMDGYSA